MYIDVYEQVDVVAYHHKFVTQFLKEYLYTYNAHLGS